MKAETEVTQAGGGSRLRAIELLQRYSSLTNDELAELKNWFLHKASALDVGLIASEHDILPSYRAFRRQHLDRVTPLDIAIALVAVAAVVLLVLLAYRPG